MSEKSTVQHAPFGTLLGYAPGGVAIYSSDYDSLENADRLDDSSFRHYLDKEYMGYKWQCVEFARRFLYLNYGTILTDVRMAYEIFSLRYLRQVVNDNLLPLQAFANGSERPPQKGALLIWQEGGEFIQTGHVAIVTQVLSDRVRIAEQNVIHHPLPKGQQWTRELPLQQRDGKYFIQDTFEDTELLGWMIQTADTRHSLPQPEVPAHYLTIHEVQVPRQGQFDGTWLNAQDTLEQTYMIANGGCSINEDPYRYLTISRSAEQELIHATNEMHLMYLHATDKVMKDDNLLALFDIPETLWPRLRLSWQRRRHHMITGRIDFCMDERGLKVYEYNADSASCHAETGLILGKWAEQAGNIPGKDPGKYLLELLASTWKHSDARPFVHILQDNDAEESYHAQFMQRALTEAGFESKIIHGLEELRWDTTGQLVDGEKRPVDCVWKTWAWETAFDQLREESEAEHAGVPIRTGHPEDSVRLIDVLLRPEVMVFEPLWTVIPSNKAILPVLWSLFPHHRYLLDADFVLNEELEQTGYAVKPIAGRCGSNIGLINHDDEVLDETSGKFDTQKNIYQQLWCLPKVGERYIQLCAFTVGGHYGGVCVRSEKGLVIKKESDIDPLRIIDDEDYIFPQ